MNYLHVCWLCSSEFHFALAFDVVVAASCFLLRIQKHLSREILPHTLEVKRSSRRANLISYSVAIFWARVTTPLNWPSHTKFSTIYSSSSIAKTTKLSTIKGFSPFFLLALYTYSPNIQDTSESQYSFKASILTAHSMTKSSIFGNNLRPISKFCSYTPLPDSTCFCITSSSSKYTSNWTWIIYKVENVNLGKY